MMTESYSKFDVIKKFYVGENGKNGSHLPFNFQMIDTIKKESKAADFVTMVDGWFEVVPEGKVTNWVVSQQLITLYGSIADKNLSFRLAITITRVPLRGLALNESTFSTL